MNREQRRKTKPAPDAVPLPGVAKPVPLAGALGKPVILGGERYNLAVYPASGIGQFQQWFQAEFASRVSLAIDAPTVGSVVVLNVARTGAWPVLRELMDIVLADDLGTVIIEDIATTAELAEAIDTFFEDIALGFYRTILKNSVAEVSTEVQASILGGIKARVGTAMASATTSSSVESGTPEMTTETEPEPAMEPISVSESD
jgi:hypothetical protein